MIIKATTDGQVRREEFTSGTEEQFEVLLSQVKADVLRPMVIGKEGNLFSLYYDNTCKPSLFEDDYDGYCIKLNNETLAISLKGYLRGNTSGIEVDYEVAATGHFLNDDTSYTLYHGEGVTFEDALIMAKPYTGTTYKNGEVTRITEYNKG